MKYSFRFSLGIEFLLLFTGIVLVPLGVLYFNLPAFLSDGDYYDRQEIFNRHIALAEEIDSAYKTYRKAIFDLTRTYYKAINSQVYKQNTAFRGNKDPELKFNITGPNEKFFDFIEDPDLISPERKMRYIMAYNRLTREAGQLVYSKIIPDTANLDKSPLSIQILVMEKDQKFGEWLYTDLLGADEKVYSFESKKEREGYFMERGILPYIRVFPVHPALYMQGKWATVWGEIIPIFRYVVSPYVFGFDLFDHDVARYRDIIPTDNLQGMRGKSVETAFLTLRVEIGWDLFPSSFSYEKYRYGKEGAIPAPDALFAFVVDISQAEEQFVSLLGGGENHFFADFLPQKLIESFTGLDFVRLSGDQLNVQAGFLPDYDKGSIKFLPEDNAFQSGFESLFADGKALRAVFGRLNPQTGGISFEGDDLDIFMSDLQGEKDISALARSSIEQGNPLHFSFTALNQDFIGSFVPSATIQNMLFFFYDRKNELLVTSKERRIFNQFFLLLSLFAAVLCGRLLSLRIVRPVLRLNDFVKDIPNSRWRMEKKPQVCAVEDSERLLSDSGSPREIKNLAADFVALSSVVQDSLFQVSKTSELNFLMLSDKPAEELLGFILQSMIEKSGAEFGLMGFFDNSLSNNPGDYLFYGSDRENLAGKLLFFAVRSFGDSDEEYRFFYGSELDKCFSDDMKGFMFRLREKREGAIIEGLFVLLHIREEFQADLAALLCRQAAIVILKTNLDEIASDTMLGRQLQKELLPTCFPDFAGIEASYVHQPSLGLAGDYYDFPDTGKGNLCAFLIADVSGKGIGAALYGAGAKAALSTFIRESPDPSVLLCRLNDFLCELMVRDLFLTLFIGIFEKDSGVLHYASAGHNKMILIKKTGELVYLSAEGIPLGLFPRTGYEKKTVAIDEGDILFLYTDGVTELENESLEFYGLNRLESFLLNHRNTDPDQLINSFCWSLEKFRGRRVPSDDITAVYMRFNSASDSKGFS